MLKLNLQHKQTKIIRDVTEFLIESTKLIYQNFLKMVTNCRREKLSPEEAETEYVMF
jgi:hypothetical protein